jgi:hypothetical protein
MTAGQIALVVSSVLVVLVVWNRGSAATRRVLFALWVIGSSILFLTWKFG